MKQIFRMALLVSVFSLISACALKPQTPITLKQTFWSDAPKKVGVVMAKIPELDVYLPGAGCLLCLAAAEIANSSISSHLNTLSSDDLVDLKREVAQKLKKKGVDVVVIESDIDFDTLPKYKSETPNSTRKDYSSFKASHGLTHLVVINVTRLGVHRTYSSYIPTSDPKGSFFGASYMVNLSNNTYDWYKPLNVLKSVNDEWDEPPLFPALTNAYYQALETGKDSVLAPFSE